MNMKHIVLCLGALVAQPTFAATVSHDVDAKLADKSTAGYVTGQFFTSGQSFSVMVSDPTDTWVLGAPPREFTADGLEVDVGTFYGSFSFAGFTEDFGTLVGRIGTGNFFAIGLGGVFEAVDTGVLSLFNWDTAYGDNEGSIRVDVAAVPVPAAGLLLLSALGLGAAAARKRRKAV